MKKIKTFLCGLMVLVSTFCVLVFMACGEQSQKETKYDVAIRVKCSDGNIYEFLIGEDEKHITIPYDGTERTFTVAKYWLEGYADVWFDQLDGATSTKYFSVNILKEVSGNGYDDTDSVKDEGNYCVQIRTDSPIMSLTNYKCWLLNIVVE